MVIIDDLIKDEREAIDGYKMFLKQGATKRQAQAVKRIIADEEKHIRMLGRI